MDAKQIESLIDRAAIRSAERTLAILQGRGYVRYHHSNSFKKTEDLLFLYNKLPKDHKDKGRIDKALEAIKDDDYAGVIDSRYFDGMTISEIAEIYNCTEKNISVHKNRLIKVLAKELFPEDVAKEVNER